MNFIQLIIGTATKIHKFVLIGHDWITCASFISWQNHLDVQYYNISGSKINTICLPLSGIILSGAVTTYSTNFNSVHKKDNSVAPATGTGVQHLPKQLVAPMSAQQSPLS